MPSTFDDVAIDGGFVREMRFFPSKTLEITIVRAPSESEKQVTTLSKLVFEDTYELRCRFDADPWLEIRSHSLLQESDLLNRRSVNEPEISQKAREEHFQIVCNEGVFDILARGFIFSIQEEIPHHGQSVEID